MENPQQVNDCVYNGVHVHYINKSKISANKKETMTDSEFGNRYRSLRDKYFLLLMVGSMDRLNGNVITIRDEQARAVFECIAKDC